MIIIEIHEPYIHEKRYDQINHINLSNVTDITKTIFKYTNYFKNILVVLGIYSYSIFSL